MEEATVMDHFPSLWGNTPGTLSLSNAFLCIPVIWHHQLCLFTEAYHMGILPTLACPAKTKERPISQNNRKLHGDRKSLLPPVSELCWCIWHCFISWVV